MPLTFAHPAAALPLARLRLPLSALVVGTMAPDFVYYVRLAPRGHYGHTLPGLFLFCLPAGLAVLWLFHRVVKSPLVALSPEAAQRRLAPYVASSPFDRPLALVAVSILVGAVTHDVWDAFTHGSGWGVQAVPALRRLVALGPLGVVKGYKLAQHGSTLVGLTALAGAGVAWWRRAVQVDVRAPLAVYSRALRLGGLTVPPVLFGVTLALAHASRSASPIPAFAGRFVVATTSAAFVAVVVYGVWSGRLARAG